MTHEAGDQGGPHQNRLQSSHRLFMTDGPGAIPEANGASADPEAGDRRYRWLMEMATEGIWRLEIVPPISTGLPTIEQSELMLERARLVECNPAYAGQYGYAEVTDLIGERLLVSRLRNHDEKLLLLNRFVTSGYRVKDLETHEFDRQGRPITTLKSIVGIIENGDLVGAWGIQRDITAEVEVREALRAGEERFRSVIENVSDMVSLMDAGGKIHFVNRASEMILGCPPDELIGDDGFQRVHPEDVERVRSVFHDVMLSPGLRSPIVRFRYRHSDGSWRHLEAVGKALVDETGEPMMFASCRDVTGELRVEAELRESREYLRRIIDSIGDPIFVKDSRHRFVLVNDAMCAMTGRPRGEIVGKTDYDFFPKEQVEVFLEKDDEVMHTGRESLNEEEVSVRQGTIRTIVTRKTPFTDEHGAKFVVGVIRDITERKAAENRLMVLAAAVEQAADEIVITDADGEIVYVNSAFTHSTGYSLAEATGRKTNLLKSGKQEESFYRSMWSTLQEGRTWQGRLTNRTKDGRLILQDATISCIRGPEDRIVGYVSARRDVTQQAEAENRAAQSEKMEAIGTLAGGIAHDFNNILTAIIGYAQMAQKKSEGQETLLRDLDAILSGSHRAAELVKQILAFSRQEQREEKPVQVSLIVKEALNFLRASLPSTIEVHRDIRSDSVVLADPTEIHRIVINLCSNAALAMSDRSGRIDVKLEDVEPSGSFRTEHPGAAPGRHIRLTVRDSGCGISPDVLERIFEPFFTTRGPENGTGMGLAVVHGIVTRCRGAITVESEPGRGTKFEVYLPVSEIPAAVMRPDRPKIPGGAERIVFVDDEPVLTHLAVARLSPLGYRIVTFTDSLKALEALERDPGMADLVITDMTMPGLRGDVLARRIKEIRPDLPVMLCSGYSREIAAESARERGIDEFVEKPILFDDLSQRIRRLLDRS